MTAASEALAFRSRHHCPLGTQSLPLEAKFSPKRSRQECRGLLPRAAELGAEQIPLKLPWHPFDGRARQPGCDLHCITPQHRVHPSGKHASPLNCHNCNGEASGMWQHRRRRSDVSLESHHAAAPSRARVCGSSGARTDRYSFASQRNYVGHICLAGTCANLGQAPAAGTREGRTCRCWLVVQPCWLGAGHRYTMDRNVPKVWKSSKESSNTRRTDEQSNSGGGVGTCETKHCAARVWLRLCKRKEAPRAAHGSARES